MLRLFRTFLLAWILNNIKFKGNIGFFPSFCTFLVAFRFITLSLKNKRTFHINHLKASRFPIFAYRRALNFYQIQRKLAQSILRIFCTFWLTWMLDSIMLRGSLGVTSAFTSVEFRSVSLRCSDRWFQLSIWTKLSSEVLSETLFLSVHWAAQMRKNRATRKLYYLIWTWNCRFEFRLWLLDVNDQICYVLFAYMTIFSLNRIYLSWRIKRTASEKSPTRTFFSSLT